VLVLKRIAVTGGVSSGKSTVCQLLADRGSYVVDTDQITHNLLLSDPEIREKTIALLGKNIVENGQISRKLVAEKVFSQKEALSSLELILHPAIFHELELQYQQVKGDPKYNLFVAEVPLLYETDSDRLFDCVVVVLAEKEICCTRFIENKNGSERSFEERMQRQMEPTQKAAKAHFILINNDNLKDLEKQVINLLTNLRSI